MVADPRPGHQRACSSPSSAISAGTDRRARRALRRARRYRRASERLGSHRQTGRRPTAAGRTPGTSCARSHMEAVEGHVGWPIGSTSPNSQSPTRSRSVSPNRGRPAGLLQRPEAGRWNSDGKRQIALESAGCAASRPSSRRSSQQERGLRCVHGGELISSAPTSDELSNGTAWHRDRRRHPHGQRRPAEARPLDLLRGLRNHLDGDLQRYARAGWGTARTASSAALYGTGKVPGRRSSAPRTLPVRRGRRADRATSGSSREDPEMAHTELDRS